MTPTQNEPQRPASHTNAPTCPFHAGGGPRPPRPPLLEGVPFFGNTFQILRHPWAVFRTGYRTLGPAFRVRVLGTDASVLAGPDVHDLFTEAGDNFLERGFFYAGIQQALGAREFIFRTKGERHHEHRRITSLAYSRHIAAEHVPEAAAIIARGLDRLEPGRAYDAPTLAGLGMLAAAGPMLGDCDLEPHLAQVDWYFAAAMGLAGKTRSPLIPWTPKYRRLRRHALGLGRRLLDRWRDGEIGHGSKSYVVGALADAVDAQGRPLSDEDVIALLILAMGGVSFYVNRVVAFMLYELFRDEVLRRRVTAEVDAAFAGGYSYDALRDTELLRGVYLEALRRYPIWHLVPFRAEQDFVFAGTQIEAGEILLLSSVQEHFQERFYAEPERFDAERCLPPREEHKQPGAFGPFGRGSRRCVATGQSEVMAMLYTAILLHRGRFHADPRYTLVARMKPLPVPHGFRLWFDGTRPSRRASGMIRMRSHAQLLDDLSARLEAHEIEALQATIDQEMEIRVLPPGTEVFRQGDRPDALYVIESGEVEVWQEAENEAASEARMRLKTLDQGDVFGEIGILRRQPRSATIVVSSSAPLVALRCTAEAYERLLGTLNITGEELVWLIRRRKVAAAIGRLVRGLGGDILRSLVADAELRRGTASEVFVKQGAAAEAFYVIERGTFEVVRERPGAPDEVIARLREGDFFGEVGLIARQPRTATVRVAADCPQAATLVIGEAAFTRLMDVGTFRQSVFERYVTRSVR